MRKILLLIWVLGAGCVVSAPPSEELEEGAAALLPLPLPCEQPQLGSSVGAVGCEVCGDGVCDSSESNETCPSDCAWCGDGYCAPSEQGWCAQDCDWCGDQTCSGWEGTANCPGDCGTACGDGVCNGSENAASCAADCNLPTTLTVEKVRYCKWSFPVCNSAVTRPEYNVWESNGVDNEKQKRTFLSRASDPPKSKVRHLVFIAAGQQNGWEDDQETLLTGQGPDWNTFSSTESSKQVATNPSSLARRLVGTGRWPISDTFIGLAFDARFNFDFGAGEKSNIEEAYYQWLKGKFYSSNLQAIYLAGFSRGGCLVARLGRRFNQEFPNIRLIVHIFDGVCAEHTPTHPWDGPEFGLLASTEDNPVSQGDLSAWEVDVNGQFPNKARLAVRNMVGGEKVLIDAARAFTHVDAQSNPTELFEGARPWYHQTWHDLGHAQMDGSALITEALAHFLQSCNQLGC